ncbi:MAG TPA: methylmalonyl-CoA mutase family protein, partial [Bryobacteraceae bacterium]|nr:methylmalonyl-CoA mutase family protein [Bryobacteraceae bacterium]
LESPQNLEIMSTELPGQYPFTRGIYPDMYRGRLWTMRQYAGFGTAEESNQRYRYLLSQGITGLSVAFDLPTQMGMDSDHPLAAGEVGRVGVAICSLADMQRLFEGIQLAAITTSMTINSTAAILLCFYTLVARGQGADLAKISGTIQNDILKEYIARGTYIYPPRPAMRIITDLFAWAARELPEWNTISISGYHIREAGSTAIQEVAFTLADAIAYIGAAIAAGLDVDAFAPRLSFFFNSHSNFMEEIAKFRAARRLYAKIMRERFGARNPRSMMLRFHVQTAGSTLTAQQPDVNVVRVSMQALAAVLGGAQSLHTNAKDEALGLPTEDAARLALRTQQIIAHETGVTNTADPLGGSVFIENLTDEIERGAEEYIERIDAMGGTLAAIENGFIQNEIQNAAYAYQQTVERGQAIVVGVNKFQQDQKDAPATFRLDPELEKQQIARLRDLRASRDHAAVDARLRALEAAARSSDNLMPHILACAESYATVGEISDRLRVVFGEYRER